MKKVLFVLAFISFSLSALAQSGQDFSSFGDELLVIKNKIEILGIKDQFTEHGTISELKLINEIDEKSVQKKLAELILSSKIQSC